MGITHAKVSTVADGSTTEHIRPSDWNSNHSFSSDVNCAGSTMSSAVIILSSGSATITPLKMVAGALNSTSTTGAVEYDGVSFYMTPNTSARSVVRTEQLIVNTSARTGTTVLTAQAIFDASTGLNGAFTHAQTSVAYMFEANFTVTNRSTTSNTHSFGFGGTATVTKQSWLAITGSPAATSTPVAATIVRCTTTSIINTANTLAVLNAFITGKINIGATGTVIPQLTRSAGTIALVIAPDASFRIWPLSSGDPNRIGHWS